MLVSINGDRASSKLPIELKENEINLWNEEFERLSIKEHPINQLIEKLSHRFNSLVSLEHEHIAGLSARELRNEIFNIKIDKTDVLFIPFMWEFYHDEIVGSSRYAEGTQENYLKAFRHMERFTQKGKKLTFKNIDYKFANSFKNYLLKADPKSGRRGMTEVSALGIIKKFRKLIKHAIMIGIKDKNPFNQIKLSSDSREKENFPLSELSKLFDLEPLTETERNHSLVFQFMILTGCAYSDAQSLKPDNIIEDTVGVRLTYRRVKTDSVSTQYLTRPALDILKKVQDNRTNYLLPRVANQHLNRMLKVIGLKQGISIPMNSHMGRAIYRQLLNEAGLVKSMTIDKLMGWSSRSKIESRYMSVSETDLIDAQNKLELYLFYIFNRKENTLLDASLRKSIARLWIQKSSWN